MHQHPPQPILDAQRLEQHLPLRRSDVDVAGHEVGELARLVHPREHLLDNLVRQAGFLAQLGRPGSSFPVQRDEGRIFQIERKHLLGLTHDRLEIPLFVRVVDGDAAPLPVEQQLHAGKPALKLSNAGDGPDGVEYVGVHALDVLPL